MCIKQTFTGEWPLLCCRQAWITRFCKMLANFSSSCSVLRYNYSKFVLCYFLSVSISVCLPVCCYLALVFWVVNRASAGLNSWTMRQLLITCPDNMKANRTGIKRERPDKYSRPYLIKMPATQFIGCMYEPIELMCIIHSTAGIKMALQMYLFSALFCQRRF